MHSFDIFDTLITRSTAVPRGIFMLMEKRMCKINRFDSFLCANFYELRSGAERLARRYARSAGREEVTLDDIYKILSMTTGVSEEQLEELKKLEVDLECDNVLGIRKNIALLKKLKKEGERVVLISDMYLDEESIRCILCRVDSVFADIPVYVSSAYGKTKGNGSLFLVVQKQEQINFSDWIHYGDNESADIRAAMKLGIKAIHLVSEELKEYEHPEKSIYHQLSVGSSRYVRTLGRGDCVSEVGSSLAGPILYPYVKWILRESLRNGINRLYFVARDGWILQHIADKIIEKESYQIHTAYIYGSRVTWRLPCYDGSKEDLRELLYYSNVEEVSSWEGLAKLFQLSLEELLPFLPEKSDIYKGEKQISKSEADTVCKWLQENEAFRRYLVKSQGKNRELVIHYLQQELDVSDDRFAFVELSGSGFTQQCLAKILGNFYTGEVKNFFYCLSDAHGNDCCRFFQFYPNDLKRYFMLELMCRAPHGQVTGYKEEAGIISPVLESREGEWIKEYGIETYRVAVLAYVQYMEDACVRNGLAETQKLDIVKEYMELIAEHPPKRIAEYFGHMPFSCSGKKNAMVEFAPPISKKQLRKMYFWDNGKNIRHFYQGDHAEYALTVSNEARVYKEKCERYRKSWIGKWIINCIRFFPTCHSLEFDYYCPREFLQGNVVIYGAGKVGQDFVKQAQQKRAGCIRLLWVDSNYIQLQAAGLDVKSPEEIKGHSFDRIIIAVHHAAARQEIWERLRNMGIEAEKIYYG